jgi:hypothetical protein
MTQTEYYDGDHNKLAEKPAIGAFWMVEEIEKIANVSVGKFKKEKQWVTFKRQFFIKRELIDCIDLSILQLEGCIYPHPDGFILEYVDQWSEWLVKTEPLNLTETGPREQSS